MYGCIGVGAGAKRAEVHGTVERERTVFSTHGFEDARRHFAVGTLCALLVLSSSLVLCCCPWPDRDVWDGFAEETCEPAS